MAPSLVELSPAGVEMWYKDATPNDVFVAYCGLGYFYPNVAPYMETHAERLSGFLERADLRTLLVIDRAGIHTIRSAQREDILVRRKTHGHGSLRLPDGAVLCVGSPDGRVIGTQYQCDAKGPGNR